ncbi:hypothetical protein Goklo_024154 [Gossypium klotzschianum]|uniref:Uncharacterized protein n=1 Tax=Gossypium klotzschianum TaxID=34286 RepID=A0A7J8WCT9_9ROSI|nr:hypothetical protein [Gossypium klotzschianum]
MAIFQNLQEEEIEWRASWLRQFVPITQGLAECEFSYRGDGYKKRVREISYGVKGFEKKETSQTSGKENFKSRNSVVKLKASLNKIEEMKSKIEELEAALRNCEVRIEHLEAKECRQNEQLHYFQNQVRNRDHVMGEDVVQIREVADHLQTLAVQANRF